MSLHQPDRAVPVGPGLEVGVVGAGTMGVGIAQVAAAAGHRTLVVDARPGAARQAVAGVAARLARSVDKGRTSPEQAAATVDRLVAVEAVADLAGCGLVVEAVVEDLAAKHDLLHELEDVVAADAVLASNTSSLSLTDLAAPLRHPGRVVGLHFFNPAPLMRLVEVVRGERTDPAVVRALVDLAVGWGKVPVVCTSTPGFVVNRVARPFYGEAFRLLERCGGDLPPEVVDGLLREAGGFPMGPLELTDLIGQDVNAAVNRSVWRGTGEDPRYTPSPVQDALVAAGHLGRKSGRGFYEHGATPGGEAPGDAAPGDAAPGDAAPGDAAPGDAAPGDGAPGGGTPGGTAPGGGAPGGHPRGTSAPDTGQDGTGPTDLPRLWPQDEHARVLLARAGAGTDEHTGVAVRLTDGRPAAQVEAATGSPVVLLDLARDPATCTRVGAVASPGCPDGTLTALTDALAAAGVDVTPLPDVPGLVVARTAAALVNAAEDAAEAGVAGREDVDLAMEHGAGHPQGPLAWGRHLGDAWVVGVLDALHADDLTGRYRVAATLRARAMLALDRVSAWLGLRLVQAGPGLGVVRGTVTEGWLNGFGIVHGGVVCTVADSALAVACNSHGPLTVGAGLDVTWVSPGRAGDVLVATATERARYGRNGVYDITVRRDDGSLVAEVRGRTRTAGSGAPAKAAGEAPAVPTAVEGT